MNAAFWSELEHRIAKYDLLCHPFYQAWSAGKLTREDLREYAANYWHHVSAFPTYLSAFHARLDDAELRRTVVQNLADEEGIDSPDGKPHSELWMDFACAMGADHKSVRSGTPVQEVSELVNDFRTCMSGPVAAALATLYAYESQVPRIAAEKRKGLRELYDADDVACRYFALHETADVHHANVWRSELQAVLSRAPEEAEGALNAAEQSAQALWRALDGIERERLARVN
jgi:pyrroloquinoline-quinone synthase